MRVYLDTCTIQRPVDASQEARVQREAAAVVELLGLIRAGELALVSSSALQIEHSRNPQFGRWVFTEWVLSLAADVVPIDPAVEQRSQHYQALGMKELDAVHLACAVQAGVDFICTCDDRFLRRAKKADTGLTRVVSPLELMQEVKR
ncbi:MAG TPA: PIN domain-containing protein [Longimicrobium sp.]|nr:PIN domain-containing protein [Longimicrobium sp.]